MGQKLSTGIMCFYLVIFPSYKMSEKGINQGKMVIFYPSNSVKNFPFIVFLKLEGLKNSEPHRISTYFLSKSFLFTKKSIIKFFHPKISPIIYFLTLFYQKTQHNSQWTNNILQSCMEITILACAFYISVTKKKKKKKQWLSVIQKKLSNF